VKFSRTDKVRAVFDRTGAWMLTSIVAARTGQSARRFGDVLAVLRDEGYLESRRDPAGSHEIEWRRVA